MYSRLFKFFCGSVSGFFLSLNLLVAICVLLNEDGYIFSIVLFDYQDSGSMWSCN